MRYRIFATILMSLIFSVSVMADDVKFVQIDGSGRTDAGVHALGQVANFKIDTDMTAKEVMAYINQYLPEEIGVIAIQEMPERFHSRLNAKRKTYCYRIWNTDIPCIFSHRYVY